MTAPDSSTIYYGSPLTDTNGKYTANFTLGSNAKLGTYVVHANAEGVPNQTTFQVDDTIYIKSDGSIEPANAPISRNGNIYNLTSIILANSTDGIVIERSNIILDGAGFTLTGKSLIGSNGINITNVSNVTVENISVKLFHNGIYGYSFSNGQIAGSNLFSDDNGIRFDYSDSNMIEGNNITQNAYAGVWLHTSQNNNISSNRLAYNTIASNHVGGINLEGLSNNNNIVGNDLLNNTWYGIYIWGSGFNNIFHNNFINNTFQAYLLESLGNSWDNSYPSGGNYWSDYTGADVKSGPNQNLIGSDGIGDTAYTMNSNDKDNYPLMNAWNPTETNISVNGEPYSVTTITNATITHFDSTPDNLNFTATGTSGTEGYLLMIFPEGLNSTDIKVYINGTELTTPPPTISDNGTHYFVYCELSFSTLQITVPFVVPVIPLGTLTATISMISILGAYVKLRKRKP